MGTTPVDEWNEASQNRVQKSCQGYRSLRVRTYVELAFHEKKLASALHSKVSTELDDDLSHRHMQEAELHRRQQGNHEVMKKSHHRAMAQVERSGNGLRTRLPSLWRPCRWDHQLILQSMIVFGLISAIFDMLTFCLLLWLLKASESQFQTAFFIESFLPELLIAVVLRTHLSVFQSRPGISFAITRFLVRTMTTAILYASVGASFGFFPVTP